MNASAQALSISIVRKIANVSAIVQTQFPSVLVDFSPWALDEQTQKRLDPDSIDIAFSFPTWQSHLSCGCILLQVYFAGNIQSPKRTLSRIKLTGHDWKGQNWRFSARASHQFSANFSGIYVPSSEGQQQLRVAVSQLLKLFGCPASLPL